MAIFLDILLMYEWLIAYLLKSTYEHYQRNIDKGFDNFKARNENQVFYSKNLSVAYVEVISTITGYYGKCIVTMYII